MLDDQDLMARLYEVGDFVHIDRLLYFQRVHAEEHAVRAQNQCPNTERDRGTLRPDDQAPGRGLGEPAGALTNPPGHLDVTSHGW